MTISATVEARDLGRVTLCLLLGAKLGGVTEFLTVGAERNTAVHNLTSVVQALKEFLAVLRPTFHLAGTVRLLGKAVGNSVFLVDVALEIHVGKDLDEGSLSRNEPETNALLDQGFLKLLVGDVAIHGLDVLIDGFFGVVDIFLSDRLLDLLPGNVGVDVGNVITIDLARLLTVLSEVTFFTTVLTDHGRCLRTILTHVAFLLAVATGHFLRVGTLGTSVTRQDVRWCSLSRSIENDHLPSLATTKTLVITSGVAISVTLSTVKSSAATFFVTPITHVCFVM